LWFENRALPERTIFWRAGDTKAARRGPWKLVVEKKKSSLFDLSSDIGEQDDLSEQNPERFNEMLRQLAAWEKEVDAYHAAAD
jgi:hypothetical protein